MVEWRKCDGKGFNSWEYIPWTPLYYRRFSPLLKVCLQTNSEYSSPKYKIHSIYNALYFLMYGTYRRIGWHHSIILNDCLTMSQWHSPQNVGVSLRLKQLWWSCGSVPPLSTQVRGSKPGRSYQDFYGWKNPQHAFLWRGSKAVGPML